MKKFFKILAMIILGLVLFINFTVLLFLIPLRNTFKENVIKEMINSINIEKEVMNSPELKESVDEVLEPVYEITREVGLNDEVVLKLLDTKEVKDFIGDISSNVYNALITGESQKLINIENIERIVSNAIDDINETGLYEIKNSTKKEIIDFVKEEATNYEDLIPDTDIVLNELSKEDKQVLDMVRFILSNEFLTIVSLITLGAFFLIILLNLAEWKWIKVVSIITLISSILGFGVTSLVLGVNAYYLKDLYSFIYGWINKYVNLNYITFGITFVISIIILIVYSIILKRKAKEKENARQIN